MRGHLDVVCSSSLLPPLSDKRMDKHLLESEGAAGSRGSGPHLSPSPAPPGGKNGRERIEMPRWWDKVAWLKGKVLWREKGKRGQGVCNGKQQEEVRILKAILVYLLKPPKIFREM